MGRLADILTPLESNKSNKVKIAVNGVTAGFFGYDCIKYCVITYAAWDSALTRRWWEIYRAIKEELSSGRI